MSRRRFLTSIALGAVGVITIANELGDQMSDLPLSHRVRFGAYAANEPWPDLSAHYELEATLGVPLPIMSWFLGFDSGWPVRQGEMAAQSGHDLLICLQPSLRTRAAVPYANILKGTWDRRLDTFFRHASAYPNKVTIRFAHEMNLGQLVQSVANPAPCTADLDIWLDTWRYVVDRQRAIGGDNVTWQWCVNSMDMGGMAAESYWPGADYVDSIGIDAYNGYGPWTSAVKTIKPMYNRVIALDPTADIWLSEIGCRSVAPGENYDKATWFTDLLASSEFPRLKVITFFNANKERDWRITTNDVLQPISATLASAAGLSR